MIALRAVAVVVICLVIHLCHSHMEHASGALNVLINLGQIGHAQRRTVLLHNRHEVKVVPRERTVFRQLKFLCRPIKGLFNEVDVFVFHFSKKVRKCNRKMEGTKSILII